MRAVIEGLQSQDRPTLAPSRLPTGSSRPVPRADPRVHLPGERPRHPDRREQLQRHPFLACGGYSPRARIPPTPCLGSSIPGPATSRRCLRHVPGALRRQARSAPEPSRSVISGRHARDAGRRRHGTAPLVFAWTQPRRTSRRCHCRRTRLGDQFTAPVVAANTTLNFTLTVSNGAGSASAPVGVTIRGGSTCVNQGAPLTVSSGTRVTLTGTG